MLNNRLELSKEGSMKALLTWHLPTEDGHFHPIAFQFAEDVDDATKRQVFDMAQRPLKIPAKAYKAAAYGSTDHFEAVARPLGRLGFHTRYFGPAQHGHVLQDRPIETP